MARRLGLPKADDAFNQTFDVALHLGTLVAVVAYFWHDLVALVAAWIGTLKRRSIKTTEERIAWVVVAATIPAGLLGFAFEDVIAERLGEPWQIAICLAVFGLLLGWADRRPTARGIGDLTLRQGLAVGLAQSLALMPGVSRSGITITAGRCSASSATRPHASRSCCSCRSRSRAVVFKGLTDVVLADLPGAWRDRSRWGSWPRSAVGCLRSSGCSATCDAQLRPFVVYRLIAAAMILLLIVSGVREATFYGLAALRASRLV